MRKDLIALTPEAVASLANMGLVKRALRELAEGQAPALDEADDGTVTGTFADGVVARLPPGKTLKDAPCTCGSLAVCRHRVAVALAYKSWAQERVGPPSSVRAWSPAEIADTALERTLGKEALARARKAAREGALVTVERDGVPTAKLAACTVRFLVPRDPAYAKCDCRDAGGGCEHVALAVWAFREAEGRDGAEIVVTLGGGEREQKRARDGKAVDGAVALALSVIDAGVTNVGSLAARFAEARDELARASCEWPLGALGDLERALEHYAARNAHYSPTDVLHHVAELGARARASAAASSELPARFVLGQDEAPTTPLDHLRLVSLGARLTADGRSRAAEVHLCDPDTATVLVLRKRWDFSEKEEPEDGPALGRRAVASRVTLAAMASGQIVSKVVSRKANRELLLASSRAAMTSVTPQRGDWESLPSPVLVRDLRAHGAWLDARPPRFLRPRVLAESAHAIAVGKVHEMTYLPGEQELIAHAEDATGNPFTIAIAHSRAAPFAIDATAAALANAPRFVSGELSRAHGGFILRPFAIAHEILTVPDLSPATASPVDLPRGSRRRPNDRVAHALDLAESILSELAHVGLSGALPATRERCASAARALDEVGMSELAARMLTLATAFHARAWLDAAVRAELVRETFDT
jgi:hypothetical protein